jgi:cell division protein FtsB
MAYNRNRNSRKKELYYVICIFLTAAILIFSFWGRHGYSELRQAQLRLQEQRKHVEDLRRSNEERRENIKRWNSDKDTQEEYIRRKFYGKTGEIIYQLPSQPEKKSK